MVAQIRSAFIAITSLRDAGVAEGAATLLRLRKQRAQGVLDAAACARRIP